MIEYNVPNIPIQNRRESSAGVVLLAVLTLALLFPCGLDLSAQGSNDIRDSKGKKFWVTFMQSYGGGEDLEDADMRLYISADEPTTVTVTYNGDGRRVTVQVPNAHETYEVNLNQMFGASVELDESNLGISSKSFLVVSDNEFTLYGVSVRLQSSDAFLALPDDALTRRYIVLSYPNGYLAGFPPNIPAGFDQPSEFAVVATEDGTEVTIRPKARLNGRPNLDPFVVTMNRGDVYFAQAVLDGPEDVSGTQVRSTKPVAVFGGNKRTSIPTSVGNYRDYLVEQLPPLEAWGKGAILTPHYEITRGVSYDAVARIVSAADNTTWEINGIPQPTMSAGDVVEFKLLDDPQVVTASNPVMLAQYEHSVGRHNGRSFELGDPFMMLIPPPEQFDTAYAFQSITHELFTRHFINVVVPASAEASLRLDGVPVVVPYVPVPATPYSYAQIELSAGSHFVTCDSAFGLYAYGFGRANSYGYAGGTLFRDLVVDFQNPFITVSTGCRDITGVVKDDRPTDTGIDSCYAVAGQTSNARVQISRFTPGADSVVYTAALIDTFQDGVAMVKAIDSAGRSVTQRNIIPGFTVGASNMQGNAPQQEDVVSYNGQRICRQIDIVNYGQFEHTVDDIVVSPRSLLYSLTPSAGFALKPGEHRVLEFCYEGGIDSILNVDLSIGDSCVARNVADLTIYSIVDTIPPADVGREGSCDRGVSILFEEPEGKYRGIVGAELLSAVNARATFDPAQKDLPGPRVRLHLDPIDGFQDMIYEVALTDAAGNTARLRDTVGGYTIGAFDADDGVQVSERLGVAWGTDSLDFLGQRCDSIVLRNYGFRDLVIGGAVLERNREFSVPPSQFPLALHRGDSALLYVCLEGRFAGVQIDTLLIVDTCGRWERIPMKTPVGFGLGHGEDYCGQQLTIQAYAPSKRTFLTAPFPNPSPAGSGVGLDIGLSRDEAVTIDVVDMAGQRRLRVLNAEQMKGGVHRLHFDAGDLESGVYFCRMTTGRGETLTAKLVLDE